MTTSYPAWLDDRPLDGVEDIDVLGFSGSARWLASALNGLWTEEAGGEGPWDARWGRPPRNNISVALEGPWGSGKTSYANLVMRALVARDELSRDVHVDDPVRVEFNVWQSGSLELSPWSALCYRIGEAFYDHVHERARAVGPDGELAIGNPRRPGDVIRIPARRLAEERLHWVEVARRLADAVPDEHWHPCLALFCDAPSKVPGRGLSWTSVVRESPRFVGAALKAFLGDRGGLSAIDDAVEGLDAVTSATRGGTSWGVDSAEFVRELDRLLGVLHPKPRRWRLVLLVEDVTRLDTSELPKVLDALGYVRRLSDLVTLILLDDHIIATLERLAQARITSEEGAAAPPSEPFITKLVGLRQRVPLPRVADLSTLVARWWRELGLDGVARRGTLPATRRLIEHGLATPRQVKRALRAIWMRLASPQYLPLRRALAAGVLDGEVVERLLGLHIDLYAHTEGLLERFDLDGLEADLLALPIQPWDGAPWLDRVGTRPLAWDPGPARALVVAMRGVSLLDHLGLEGPDASGAWAAFRDAQGPDGDDPLQLAAFLDTTPTSRSLVAHLERVIEEAPATHATDLMVATTLAAAARRSGLAEDPAPNEVPEILGAWLDGDALVQAAARLDPAGQKHAMVLTLLELFHHHLVGFSGFVTHPSGG